MATASSGKSYTDVIFQGVKLYIEGVQIPFVAVSITSGIGGLPSATVTIPPQAGLMDIARFYNPKVHIFFEDRLGTYDLKTERGTKSRDKLLFSGIISQVSYNKSKNVSAGNSITFNCVHRFFPITECLIDYTGWMTGQPLNANASPATKADHANSTSALIEALQGIKAISNDTDQSPEKDKPDGKTSMLPLKFEKYFTRLIGMPGVLMNYWNQLKRASYNKVLATGKTFQNEGFEKMYQPLIEDGLQFFQRLGGHHPVELAIQSTPQESCPDDPSKGGEILIPPCNQVFIKSSVQAEMTVSHLRDYLQQSGEITTIYQIFDNFFNSIDYELLTLTSPAEAPIPPGFDVTSEDPLDGPLTTDITGTGPITYALETIVKPKLPFYFSPICNILFPGMYHSVSVLYDEINIPTRIDVANLEGVGDSGLETHFRAPHSIRQAIADKIHTGNPDYPRNLFTTTGSSYGAIGRFEQGRGVKPVSMAFPRWLSYFSSTTLGANGGSTDQAPDKDTDPIAYANLSALETGWKARYPEDALQSMNPYSLTKDNGLNSHHRILFTAADYYYTQAFARSKAGRVESLFNPHMTPGYPMDILEKNPLYPSFHALCTSVTHTITESSCSTTIEFTAAMTYTELANYYIPFVSPMLQSTLKLAENPTLLSPDDDTYRTADDFYKYTLGVTSIAPDDIFDFSTMTLNPVKKDQTGDWTVGSPDSIKGSNGGELNPMLSYEGNLSLVQRPIENRYDLENRFGLKFIDMSPDLYSPNAMKYKDKALEDSQKFEIGQSQFLSYEMFFGDPIETGTVTTGN